MRGIWLGVMLVGGAMGVACADDDDATPASPMLGAGEAGAHDSPSGGSSTSAGGKGGTGGSQTSLGGADGGSQSALAGEGGVNAADAGAGGASGAAPAAQAGSGGEGGDNGAPTGPRVPCPALGQKFELSQFADSDEDLATRAAFDCPVGSTFTIERFQLNQTRLEVLSTLFYNGNSDGFTVVPDCGPAGFVEPVKYTGFPLIFAQVLAPGIYTRVSCENDMLEEQVAVPTPAPNVDCAHAVALTPGSLQTAYAETRIWNQPALFYKLSLSEPAQPDTTWELTINGNAAETSGSATVKLHGVSSAFEQEGEIHALNTGHPAIFDAVPPGDYCVEVSTANGVKYSIFYSAFASP